MAALTLNARVWKVEKPANRYVPYVTVELYRINHDGQTETHGSLEMPEMSFRDLTGEDPVHGAEYEISMVKRG